MLDTTDTNTFNRYAALGYGDRLVPIIPPGAPLNERSSLHKRFTKPQNDPRGKAVGVQGRDGTWHGLDWISYEADHEDHARWFRMGAGLGIKTGNGLVAIDADTMGEAHAKTIRDIIRRFIDTPPIRIGRYPKALYVVRCSDPYRYTRVEFGTERVEILSDGRQFVAEGIHPITGKPYAWPREIVAYADLPIVSAETLDEVMEALRQALPEATPVQREGSAGEHGPINQDALRGNPETVKAAVSAMPNDNASFATREAYLQLGYAIKAALPDNENEAFDIFADWCARWQDGENDPGTVEADWRRMKPPFRRGAGWLYEQAERLAPEKFSQAQVWFEPIPDTENPFDKISLNPLKVDETDPAQRSAAQITATPYACPDPASIPPREWLYGTQYIRSFVSATLAPSGVGKTSLTTVEALAMVTGKPLLGVEPKGVFRVWLWNGEDPMDELNRKVAAAMQHYGLTAEDLGGRLFVDSGRDMEICLGVSTRDGTKIYEPVERALLNQISLNAFDAVIVDPFVSSHRVAENDNGAIDLVAKRWARIANAGRCAIELVHHVRKLNGAEVTVEDGRGASAMIAAARPVRAIAKLSKGEAVRMGLEAKAGRMFRFADGKNNLAPPADSDGRWFEMVSVGLGNGVEGDGIDRLMSGDHVGVVTLYKGGAEVMGVVGAGAEAEAMNALRCGEWRRDSRAGEAWAGHIVARVMGLDVEEAGDKARCKAILSEWIKRGLLREVDKRDGARRLRTFIEVAERDNVSEKEDVFA